MTMNYVRFIGFYNLITFSGGKNWNLNHKGNLDLKKAFLLLKGRESVKRTIASRKSENWVDLTD